MADLLHRPWILASLSKWLSDENDAMQLPKIVQIIGSKDNQVKVSDKFHFVLASVAATTSNDLVGGLIKIEKAQWMVEWTKRRVCMLIENFTYLGGGGGCTTHGEPTNVVANSNINALLHRTMIQTVQMDNLLNMMDPMSNAADVAFTGIPSEQEHELAQLPFWEKLHESRTDYKIETDYFESLQPSTNNWKVLYETW